MKLAKECLEPVPTRSDLWHRVLNFQEHDGRVLTFDLSNLGLALTSVSHAPRMLHTRTTSTGPLHDRARMDDMDDARASRTAVLACQGRAVGDGRLAVGRFEDRVAAQLLHPDELAAVERARGAAPSSDWRDRLASESLRACAEVVVPRTVAIDDAVREADHRQVVIVGAGLDSRPWRLEELRDVAVFALDHPASQADAQARSAGLKPITDRLTLVAVDLAQEDVDQALAGTDHDPEVATTWVWEGVVPYLTQQQVEATVAGLSTRSAPGSVLVVNYQSPSRIAALGRRVAGLAARFSRQVDPLKGEPRRSSWTPDRMRRVLAHHGFDVRRDEDLMTVAARISSPTTHRRSIGIGRVAVAAYALSGSYGTLGR